MFGGDFDEKYFVFWGLIEVWFLTQGSLLCRDDNFGGDCFGMGDWVLTQRSLLRRDDKVWGCLL